MLRYPGHVLQAEDVRRGGYVAGQTRDHARDVQGCGIGRSVQS